MFELRHLRYTVAAADQGSFRRAALAMNIEKFEMSRRIRDLETEIGAALFIRHTGSITLTQAGEVFVRHARHALKQ